MISKNASNINKLCLCISLNKYGYIPIKSRETKGQRVQVSDSALEQRWNRGGSRSTLSWYITVSFKHWFSVSTLPPLVTPCFFSTATGHTWVGEGKNYLQCLVSNNQEALFCCLYPTSKWKGFQSLIQSLRGIAVYVCCNIQQVKIIIWEKFEWASPFFFFFFYFYISNHTKSLHMMKWAFADRNWAARRAVTQITNKNARGCMKTKRIRNSNLSQVSVFSLFDWHYFYYQRWGAYCTLHCIIK